ncbi:MAG: methionyl-tRNA formyltransferase [Candidatus Moranbacteria bacterium CG_4_8_14_3_um_filter_34_16]|nr:MAG: methionyl-tRNA formyltransferase [Candidatus Moranbacteria bacterium CG08_land_8_20_14_0_20_34_16]PIW94753.1 MAG: methionyl-tRNA formyltransferase [Candidatus Moranbacteria bacterium CG_4_8_14_3_um_filter_34_16]PJA89454.1 MAG: methionyl-tRNA formyltransferase [Candidatus Moranbacteria bacterium CG_4_9_14_3_um_filter_33_15]
MIKDPIKINILFFGASFFATSILKGLIENNYNIISVVTQKEESEKKSSFLTVRKVAQEKKINVFTIEKFNEKSIKQIEDLKPDLIIVASYGKIIPQKVLDIPGFGIINVHPSLLPKFRGPSPIQNAILEGEEETGSTIILMNEKMDEGDILDQKKISFSPEETYPELLQRISQLSSELLLKTIPLWVRREITPQKQDETKATYCQLIERLDGKINWSENAQEIFNRFRAFLPWPGVFTYWQKNDSLLRMKIHQMKILENYEKIFLEKFQEGEVFSSEEKIVVKTGEGAIVLEEIQMEGKNKIKADDFLNGYPDFIGTVLR